MSIEEAAPDSIEPTTEAIAKGILEVKSHWQVFNPKMFNMIEETDLLPIDIQHFLDNFYMSRIGIRMLIGQHVFYI